MLYFYKIEVIVIYKLNNLFNKIIVILILIIVILYGKEYNKNVYIKKIENNSYLNDFFQYKDNILINNIKD